MSGNGKQGVSWTSNVSSVMLERKLSNPGNEVRPGAQEGSQRNSRRAVENRSAAGKDCGSPRPGHGSRGQRGLLLRQRSSLEPLEWEHWLQDPRLPGLTLGRIKQWEIAQRKPLKYKTQHHPTTSSTLCGTSHLNNKQNEIQTQPSADRITTSLNLAHRRKNKQKNNNKKLSTNLTL